MEGKLKVTEPYIGVFSYFIAAIFLIFALVGSIVFCLPISFSFFFVGGFCFAIGVFVFFGFVLVLCEVFSSSCDMHLGTRVWVTG